MSAPRPLDPALLAALLTTLATALLYAAGWSYAYHFYDRLNLGLIGLEIPLQYHFIYGFWALRWGWWLLIPLAIGRLAWPRHGARWFGCPPRHPRLLPQSEPRAHQAPRDPLRGRPGRGQSGHGG